MLRIALSFLMLSWAAGQAWAQQAPARIVRVTTGVINLPGKLGPLNFVEVNTYSQPELGVGVRYAGPGLIKADVFIYDLGEKDLGSGLKSPLVKSHFDQVKQDIFEMQKEGGYLGVTKLVEQETALETRGGKFPALQADFTYSQAPGQGVTDTGLRVSHLFLSAYRDSFVKIRFTYPQTQRAEGEKALKEFLRDFGKLLK